MQLYVSCKVSKKIKTQNNSTLKYGTALPIIARIVLLLWIIISNFATRNIHSYR